MTHDPLCPQQPRDDGTTLTMLDVKQVNCACAFLHKAREDERSNVTAEFMANHGDRWEYEQGQRDMLAKCITAVEALDDGGDTDTRYILASTAATLRSLQEKP